MTHDNILLAAFGGPTPGCCGDRSPCPGEARCFVEGILGRDPKRAGRVNEVVGHYRQIGGFSPFNGLAFAQAEALGKALASRDVRLPIRVGMRHWRPWLKDVLAEISRAGHRRTLAVIMAPHQSAVSWTWYQQVVADGLKPLGDSAQSVDYLDPWPTHPGYIKAVVDGVREAVKDWSPGRFVAAELVFTAHAIPLAVAAKSLYTHQIGETARAAARALGKANFRVAYQSQASDSDIPWTGPDIKAVISEAASRGIPDVVCSPAGFLSDHVEVLYDLDIAARATAEACGIGFKRAPTVGTHPAFIGMLADLVVERFTKVDAA